MVLDGSVDSSSHWLLPYTDPHGPSTLLCCDADLKVYGPFNTASKAERFHAAAHDVLGHALADLHALVDDADCNGDADLNQRRESMERLLKVDEVAALLFIKIKTVYDLAGQGIIPSKKIGRLRRFDAQELEAWLKKNKGQ